VVVEVVLVCLEAVLEILIAIRSTFEMMAELLEIPELGSAWIPKSAQAAVYDEKGILI
jgi:hypothetical protein